MELTKEQQTQKFLDMYDTCLEMLSTNKDAEDILQCIDNCKKTLEDPLLIHQLILFRHTMEEFLQN